MIGNGLYPKPPICACRQPQNLSDGELSGSLRMACDLRECRRFPMAGEHEAARQLEAGSLYPASSPSECGERIEMERYNPKGPDDREEEQQEK